MLSGQARDRHLHHCRVFYRFGFQQAMLYCTMHPSGSRCSIFIALVKMSRASESQKMPDHCFSARFHESPLSSTADPENDRFQAVSKGWRQLSWLRVPAFQWLTAWSVKMQRSDQSGAERVSNQPRWFFQLKNGFPVPARHLREHFLLLVRNRVFHNVVSCSSQFMSQGIVGPTLVLV